MSSRSTAESCLFMLLLLSGFAPLARGQASTSFVPVTPCRTVDTRGANGPLGGPSLIAGASRSFPIATSPCGVPATASAYSVNVTALPRGLLGVFELFPTGVALPPATTLIFSNTYLCNAAIVPAGTNGEISIFVNQAIDALIDVNGYFIPVRPLGSTSAQSTALGTGASQSGTQNTAFGFNSLNLNGGNANTAHGAAALSSNTTGSNNVGVGASTLSFNATGSANTAVGTQALVNNLIGNDNAAVGYAAQWANTVGSNNTAEGANALYSNQTGSSNTALGQNAMYGSMDGSFNIAVGAGAGDLIGTGSYNIDVGNEGVSFDSHTIRVGTPGNQSSAFLAGVNGVNVSGGSAVLINASGQLGTVQSSARFKDDIRDMDEASSALFQLRPVTFHYKDSTGDADKPRLQFGLIAEEVEKVYPQLVVYDSAGNVQSVQYHELPAMLLNEIQKQKREISAQEELIRSLQTRLTAIEGLIQRRSDQAASPAQ